MTPPKPKMAAKAKKENPLSNPVVPLAKKTDAKMKAKPPVRK